jgi:hypothetical protein
MEYGSPVIFKKVHRTRRSQLYSNSCYVGILHGIFTQDMSGTKVQRAKVYCPKSDMIHTCDLAEVKTLENKPINLDSIVMLPPVVVAMTAPKNMIVSDGWEISRIEELEQQVRVSNLVGLPFEQWPVNYWEMLTTLPPVACAIDPYSNRVWTHGVVIELTRHTVTFEQNRKRPDHCVDFDPALPRQKWEEATERSLKTAMEKYGRFAEQNKAHLKVLYERRKGNGGR